MSHRRHRSAVLVGSLATCALLLSGCFGSGSSEPSAAHRTRQHSPSVAPSTPADAPSTGSPTQASTPPAPASVLRFSPRSGGKHLTDCQKLVPGDDPAEFVYYPVLVQVPTPITLDTVATDHTQGVVDAGSWVAPAAPTPETGTFKGWPPTYVAKDSNLQWSKRVRAKGANLVPGTTYNVFLRLQVDPTPGDSAVNGLVFAYHDGSGAGSGTWKATTKFSMSC